SSSSISMQPRRAGAELLQERRFVGLGGSEMLLLDVTKTADFFRNDSEADREMMIVRRQSCQHFVEHRLVVADQLALGAPFQRAAERIERRSAQAFQLRQQPERREQPGTEAHFA